MKKLASLILAIYLLLACCVFAENLFSSNPDAIEKAAESVLMLEVFDANDELIATGSGFVAYLNRYKRLNYTENPDAEYTKKYTVYFADGVVSRAEDVSITKNGIVLKQGNDVILPLTDDNKTFVAYSENGKSGKWNVPDAAFVYADVHEITPEGNRFIGKVNIIAGQIELDLAAGQTVVIKAAD